MTSFDFITDEDFRASLENDFKEMSLCIKTGANKAAVVLAGSIIETVLIDYVISENIASRDEALKFDFGKMLSLCKEKGIISSKTLDLSSVIKGYRNLIHPGRAIRLNESVDKDSAEVSKALVNIVLGEVEKLKKENYGFTAEQIVSKLENDSSSTSIIPHLLEKANPKEFERLLLKVLPQHYLFNTQVMDYSPSTMDALKECFRTAFDKTNQSTKKKVVEWLVKIFTEGTDEDISTFGLAFFRAEDLIFVSTKEANLVKQYLLGRLKSSTNPQILETIKGIGLFLEKKDALEYVDALIKGIFQKEDKDISKDAEKRLKSESYSDDVKSSVIKRIDQWVISYEGNFKPENVGKLESIKEYILDEELPF